MSQVSIGRRVITAALSAMLLMTAASIPFIGIAGASTASTTCQSGEGSQCWLDIRTPSSVRTGVAFTVQVAVTTNSTKTIVATSDPCGSKAVITLRLTDGETPISTQTVNANAGIATFSLTIASMGSYYLYASGPGGGDALLATPTTCGSYSYEDDSTTLMAVNIPLDAPIAPCPPDTNCVQATSGTGTQATLIADLDSAWDPKTPGYFAGVIPADQCGTSVPAGATPAGDPNGVLGFTLTTPPFPSPQTGVIILALNTVSKGIGQFNACWTQTVNFLTAAGTWAMKGDLPNCKQRDQVAPCVLAKTSGQHNVGFLTVLATNVADPFVYGH